MLTLHSLESLREAADRRGGEGQEDHFNEFVVGIEGVGIVQAPQQVMDGLHTILEGGVAEDLVDEIELQLTREEEEIVRTA